ncbi:hypothetical protein [Syntrophomonas palmitatica]|uniref:hypothetical protein n=1 Tax=Syntrophomonas palmitatica TaxID=402877 RepID=UPI0006D16B9E|nr:hypothetical protein [Syntrophomonas palmitatica]
MLIGSNRKGEEGKKYWCCSSFIDKRGTEIEGRMFAPEPRYTKPVTDRYSLYKAKHRKLPQERQMLCTDIWIPAGEPERAFIKAWNWLVDNKETYLQEWERAINGEDLLKVYRAKELLRLVEWVGHIDSLPYELIFKTLDDVEIGTDAKPEVIFLGDQGYDSRQR